jgi:hypothetical protein
LSWRSEFEQALEVKPELIYGDLSVILSSDLRVPLKFRETFFQSLHSGAPFRGGRLADGILIAEHADLLNRLRDGHGLQPLQGNKVLAAIRIVRKLAVVVGFRQLQERLVAS